MTKIINLKELSERQEQSRFVKWLKDSGYWVNASPNAGKRSAVTGHNLNVMGMSSGFPDIEVPFPSGGYHGFYVEMKKKEGGKLSENQIKWLTYLRSVGYYAEEAKGFEQARQMFLDYLSFTKRRA